MIDECFSSDEESIGSRVVEEVRYHGRVPKDEKFEPIFAEHPENAFKKLEDEQELLNTSLCALTTHFAQVQFRLRQTMVASSDDKELLLKSLEEFAFSGIPDVGLAQKDGNLTEAIFLRRVRQQELLEKLKRQIRELEVENQLTERELFEINESENRRVIFEELKRRMNGIFDVPKYNQLTVKGARKEFDKVLWKFEAPLKIKEEIIGELEKKVESLEKLVDVLQKNKYCSKCGREIAQMEKDTFIWGITKFVTRICYMVANLYLGYQPLNKNLQHWGTERAKLEVACGKVLEAMMQNNSEDAFYYFSSSDNESRSLVSNIKITKAVRKYLATSLRDLIQHGVREESDFQKWMVPLLNCFKQKRKQSCNKQHAWNIILRYYQIENGEITNANPNCKLSQSFDLDLIGDKDKLLIVIRNIDLTHSLYKRSYDSHFKAFVCAGLNANKLISWLDLIFQCRKLVHMNYYAWSYVTNTKFSDSLKSLKVLSPFQFDLPVDLAIGRFQEIEEAFI